MANILIVDDDAVAVKALRGILRRAGHPSAITETPGQARRFIQQNLLTDLVVLELKLKETKGVQFLENRWGILKKIPVLIYTKLAERETVRYVLGLGIQNYLIKPYNDEAIYSEILKVDQLKWRDSLFEDPVSYCRQMGISRESFTSMRQGLLDELEVAISKVTAAVYDNNFSLVEQISESIKDKSEECGFWGLFDVLSSMKEAASDMHRGALESQLEELKVAHQLFQHYLHPETGRIKFQEDSHQEVDPEEKAQRELWMGEDALTRAPIVSWKEVSAETLKLDGFPVVDSVAASFKMASSGQVMNVDNISNLVKEDPGLTAQILRVANQLRIKEKDDDDPIEEPRQAVQLIGGSRIKGIASNLKGIPESMLDHPPFTWPSFWIHQMGCAHMTQHICDSLEMPRFKSVAYWAGLIHDAGKLVFACLYPYGWEAVLKRVNDYHVPIVKAEETYFDCNHMQVAGLLAEKAALPVTLSMSLQYHLEPWNAPEHKELCAIVGLAKFLCRKYSVGFAGEQPPAEDEEVSELPLWKDVLASSAFPGFNTTKFEAQMKPLAANVKNMLAGRV